MSGQILQIRTNEYDVIIWTQRERLFHLLGKRLRDLFSADPVIFEWLVAMLGAMFGDCGEAKAQEIGYTSRRAPARLDGR